MLKYKLKIKDIKLEDFRVYLFALFKGILPKKKIRNIKDLTLFIQTKSAWVSQVTLYNYLKTRMGTKWVLHFDDEKFLESINQAKWKKLSPCALHGSGNIMKRKQKTNHICFMRDNFDQPVISNRHNIINHKIDLAPGQRVILPIIHERVVIRRADTVCPA